MNPLGSGGLSKGANVFAWVVAGGAALGYQYWRQKQQNGGAVTAAEIDAFNAERKAATAAKAAEEANKQ